MIIDFDFNLEFIVKSSELEMQAVNMDDAATRDAQGVLAHSNAG